MIALRLQECKSWAASCSGEETADNSSFFGMGGNSNFYHKMIEYINSLHSAGSRICRAENRKGKRDFMMKRKNILWILIFLFLCMTGCGDNLETAEVAASLSVRQSTGGDTEAGKASGEQEGKDGQNSSPQEETALPQEDTAAEEWAEPETEDVQDEIVTFTVSAAGDVTLGNTHLQDYTWSFRQMYDSQQDNSYFLKNVAPVFEADDFTIVNFEGVLTFSEEREERTYNMKGNPEYVNILTEGSVEAVSFGNNHRLDYGQQGCEDTIQAFNEAGIQYAYNSIVGIYESKGITVGWVSVNEASYGDRVEKDMEKGIARLKEEGADIILACCHWGTERDNYPEEYQTALGRKCIDWGADLVLGHHPHVLQGVDVYKGKYIVYSLGNFCYGGNRNPADKDTMIFQQTFTFVGGEKQEDGNITVIPCSVSSVKERNNYQPTPAKGEEAQRIIDRINLFSSEYGVKFDYDGKLLDFEGS